MKFAVGSAIIDFCKKNSFEDFETVFKFDDVLCSLDLPRNPPRVVYTFLKETIVCDLGGDWVALDTLSTSKGNQEKFYSGYNNAYIKLRFFYDGKYWNDFLVEIIAGKLFNSKPLGITILKQKPVWTPKGWGCYSSNFNSSNSKFIPFAAVLDRYQLKFPVTDRFDFTLNVYSKYLGLDASDYLTVMCLLDFILLNEDRHLNNLGVIFKEGKYYIPPIFDNGLGLFENDRKYDDLSYTTALRRVKVKPFGMELSNVIKRLPDLNKAKEVLGLCQFSKYWMLPNNLAYQHLRRVVERLLSCCD